MKVYFYLNYHQCNSSERKLFLRFYLEIQYIKFQAYKNNESLLDYLNFILISVSIKMQQKYTFYLNQYQCNNLERESFYFESKFRKRRFHLLIKQLESRLLNKTRLRVSILKFHFWSKTEKCNKSIFLPKLSLV